MKSKSITLNIPEYLTISQYKQIVESKNESSVERLIATISALTDMTVDEVKDLPLNTIREISDDLTEVAFPKETFHPLIEFNGQLYGYAYINQTSIGEYVDLENFSKDTMLNLNKIAAILYRPVVKNRFNSLSYKVKQKIKTVNNKVNNPFDYYTIEKYDSNKRKDRENLFNDFPAHVMLGALSFFLGIAGLYLNHILYLEKKMSLRTKTKMEKETMASLSANIGGGGVPYTAYLNPTSYRSPGTKD